MNFFIILALSISTCCLYTTPSTLVKESIGSLLESLSTRSPLSPRQDAVKKQNSDEEMLPYSNDYKNVIESYAQETVKKHEADGDMFLSSNDYKNAIESYKKVIAQDGSNRSVWCQLGKAYFEDGNYTESINAYTKALAIDPKHDYTFALLARAYERTNNIPKCEATWAQIVTNDLSNKDAVLEIARVLCDQQRLDESLMYLETARSHHPDDTIVLFQYANTLNTANKTEESLRIYEHLLAKHPNSSAITYNMAYTLKKLGRVIEALPLYEKTLQLDPNHAEAHFSRGLAYLAIGDFDRGWPDYEWRWKRDTQHMSERKFNQPLWDGSDFHGKTILLHAEQGLGDTFQFIRFAKVAHDKGGTVIAAVQNPLVDVLSLCPYIDRVISLNTPLPHFDCHAPLMSLPLILRTTQSTIPCEIPYLYAHATLEQEWQTRIASDKNFKVGICWQGNANYSTPFLNAVVAAKSIRLSQFEPLFKVPGVTIYNLQKVTGEEQLKEIPREWNLISFGDDFDNAHGRFMDTAALIKKSRPYYHR